MKSIYIYIVVIAILLILLVWKKRELKPATTPKQVQSNHQRPVPQNTTQIPTAGFTMASVMGSDPEILNLLNYSVYDVSYISIKQAIAAREKLGGISTIQANQLLEQAQKNCDVNKTGSKSGVCSVYSLTLEALIRGLNQNPDVMAALSNNPNYKPKIV